MPDHNSGVETIRGLVDGFSRRNSLPSVVLPSQEAQKLDLSLNRHDVRSDYKLSPRPLRRMPNRILVDSVRRQSRSADALRDMALTQKMRQTQERRLSDEIKYWRNSIIEDPIPSFTSSGQVLRDEVEESTSSQTPTPSACRPSKDAPAGPQGFDFSGLVIGDVDASVEQRITTVEVKLIDLECAIANLQSCDIKQKVALGEPSTRSRALLELSQQGEAPSTSTPVLFPQSSFDSFSTDSSISKDREDQIPEHRHSMANTLRPRTAAQSDTSTAVASHPPLPAQAPSQDEFARLIAMLTQEQEARRGLESQLKDIQNQINELRFPAAPRGPPTPGHFSTPISNMFGSSPASTKGHSVLPFKNAGSRLALRMTSSQKEHEGEETDTDDGYLDVYETPTEAREYGFGVDAPRSPMLVGAI